MAQAREENPYESDRAPLKDINHGEEQKRRRERARVHVLIHDEECGAGDRQREKGGDKRYAGPIRGGLREASAAEAKTTEEHEKNACQMPEKRDPWKREMRRSHDSGDGLMEQRDANVEEEKIGVERIKLRMDQFFDGGQIHRHVFDAVVIATDQHRGRGEHQKPEEILRALFRWGANDRVSKRAN
jgi:hypothetical protein